MGVKTIIQVAAAAPYAWRGIKKWRGQHNDESNDEAHYDSLPYDPDSRRPLLLSPTGPNGSDDETHRFPSLQYGATTEADDLPGYQGGRVVHSSPERIRRDSGSPLQRVPEVEEDEGADDLAGGEELEAEIEEELEGQGFYKGSYSQMLFIYCLVPLTTLLVWISFALLPSLAYCSRPPSSIYPYFPYFPFPLPELLTASALWCLAYLTRSPIFTFFTSLTSLLGPQFTSNWLPTALSTFFYSLTSIILSLASSAILQVPHVAFYAHPTYRDPAFKRVWFLALGWALAEGLAAIWQGYAALASYRDVIVSVKRADDPEASSNSTTSSVDRRTSGNGKAPLRLSPYLERNGSRNPSDSRSPSLEILQERWQGSERETLLVKNFQRRASELSEQSEEDVIRDELERDFEQLMAVKAREDLEELYGIPFIKIPVFISCLQRLNSILLSLGVFLLLSSAYLRSPLSTPIINPSVVSSISISSSYDPKWESTKSNKPLLITLPLTLLIHTTLGALHTPLVLPRLGVHVVVYAGLLVSLLMFFAGLGVWEALT